MKKLNLEWNAPDKVHARCFLTQLEAVKILITNNTLGAEIHIAGMKIGVCDNSMLLPIIQFNIMEVIKYLKNAPNMYE